MIRDVLEILNRDAESEATSDAEMEVDTRAEVANGYNFSTVGE